MDRAAPLNLLTALAVALTFGAAAAAEMPRLRPGLWELTATAPRAQDKPVPATKSCIDDATQKEMMDFGQGVQRQMCSRNEVRNEGGRIIAESECKLGQTRMTSRSITTFSGDTLYRTEAQVTYDPPYAGQKATTLVMEGRYLGPCPVGMKPGDVEISGKRMNLRDMRGAMGKGAK